MIENPCPKCQAKTWRGVQYSWEDPNHYDGVSEWRCKSCGARFGRWSKKELAEGESEKVFGGEK